VQQVHQHLDALFDDPVLRPPVEVQDETHPARIVFVPRVVQSNGFHPGSPSFPSRPAFAGKTCFYPIRSSVPTRAFVGRFRRSDKNVGRQNRASFLSLPE
jgi:hypothetical protein